MSPQAVLVATEAVKNTTPQERKSFVIGTTIVVGVVAVALIGVTIWKFKTITDFLGITDDAEDTKTQKKLKKLKKVAVTSNGWKSNYYYNNQQNLTISASEASKLARKIWDGFDMVNDDEEYILAGIRGCTTLADLSYICYQYRQLYGEDLYTQIEKNLSDAEQVEVFTITNKLKETK